MNEKELRVAAMMFLKDICGAGECMNCLYFRVYVSTRESAVVTGFGAERAKRLLEGLMELGLDPRVVEEKIQMSELYGEGRRPFKQFRIGDDLGACCITGAEFVQLVAELLSTPAPSESESPKS